MCIRGIRISDVRAGKNWRLSPPEDDAWVDLAVEEWREVEEADHFAEEDTVIYSALRVYPSGEVTPVVVVKEVGYADYWGDACEFVGGSWRQEGFIPNPDGPFGQEYVANPLLIDPSFGSLDHDYRKWHRDGFLAHAAALERFL